MDELSFIDETLKRKGKGKKNFKVRNSWGVMDAYSAVRKHKWFNIERPLKPKEFYTIIRRVNKLLAEELSNGRTIKFPQLMGKIELTKSDSRAEIKDGKLKLKSPIDWKRTLLLWLEDKEAREKKLIIRTLNDFTYKLKYRKFRANYNNKSFYEFKINRFIKTALKDKIKNKEVDTLWLITYNTQA